MLQNLVLNGDFTSGNQHWTAYKWYPENTVEFLPTGGREGACAKLTVRSTGDPGQSLIYQHIQMQVGKTYELVFWARRVSNVDVWVQVFANNQTISSPSFASKLYPNAQYAQIKYSFTIPGSGTQSIPVMIRLIAGSAGGSAWFDSVSIQGAQDNGQFDPEMYVETLANATIYKTADSTNNVNYGRFHAGALFVFDGIENNMTRVLFSDENGTAKKAYIKQTDCRSSNIQLEDIPYLRMATIAKSLVGTNGVHLGLNGDYCESFIHWLAGACGLPHTVYAGSTYCGPAVEYYNSIQAYDVREPNSTLFVFTGDIVYYDVVNFGTGNTKAAHAGFIVEDSFGGSNYYKTVEGNIGASQTIRLLIGDKISGKIITPSLEDPDKPAHGRTLHGVAHPFGVG